MKNYETRREQIADFQCELRRNLHKLGVVFPPGKGAQRLLSRALRDAAMVGACEERSRALCIAQRTGTLRDLEHQLIARSVLNVLGYEE